MVPTVEDWREAPFERWIEVKQPVSGDVDQKIAYLQGQVLKGCHLVDMELIRSGEGSIKPNIRSIVLGVTDEIDCTMLVHQDEADVNGVPVGSITFYLGESEDEVVIRIDGKLDLFREVKRDFDKSVAVSYFRRAVRSWK